MNTRGGALSPTQTDRMTFPPNNYAQGGNGTSFSFRKRWGQIDWRKLASIDVDRIAKEVDFQALQQNIMNITFCNIETEEFQHVDQNFIKVFKLSQLVIEYLLHSQQYLSNRSTSLEQKLLLSHEQLEKAMNEKRTHEDEIKTIKKENRKRRKVIEAYQDMINAGATGLHACPICKREFVSAEYLQSHIQRRHPDTLPKVAMEQKDLEAKLMEQMTERLLASEKQLRDEMKQREQEVLSLQIKEFENWKNEEKQQMAIEMEEFKRPLFAELEALQQENKKLEKALQQKEEELLHAQNKRQSHLGHLEGARELILDGTNKINESKAEIESLKETLESQLCEMQTTLKAQDVSWHKRMQKMASSYQDQLVKSVAKLEALEQSILESSKSKGTDQIVTKKLHSLQLKMKQQGELLLSQQNKLTTLQSREPSPVASPCDEDPNESENSTEIDYDGKYFTPIINRPMIKTKYAHRPEDIDNIRRQTRAVFSDMLVKKGLQRDANGLANKYFEEKMTMLEQEKQQKIQAHYHFAEHRQKLAREIEEIASNDYKPPVVKFHIPIEKHKYTHVNTGRPPKPKPKIHSSPTGSSTQPDNLAGTNRNVSDPVNNEMSDGSSVSITSSTSRDSEEVSSLEQHPSPIERLNVQNTPKLVVTEVVPGEAKTTHDVQFQHSVEIHEKSSGVDHSWDSEDSIEELDPPTNGRTSSTPIKVQNAVKPTKTVPLQSESVDSFDLSSSSDPIPTAHPSKMYVCL